MVTFATERTGRQSWYVALKVPSLILFHMTPHCIVILFRPDFDAGASPARLYRFIISFISLIFFFLIAHDYLLFQST
jgi:hypothetical protein